MNSRNKAIIEPVAKLPLFGVAPTAPMAIAFAPRSGRPSPPLRCTFRRGAHRTSVQRSHCVAIDGQGNVMGSRLRSVEPNALKVLSIQRKSRRISPAQYSAYGCDDTAWMPDKLATTRPAELKKTDPRFHLQATMPVTSPDVVAGLIRVNYKLSGGASGALVWESCAYMEGCRLFRVIKIPRRRRYFASLRDDTATFRLTISPPAGVDLGLVPARIALPPNGVYFIQLPTGRPVPIGLDYFERYSSDNQSFKLLYGYASDFMDITFFMSPRKSALRKSFPQLSRQHQRFFAPTRRPEQSVGDPRSAKTPKLAAGSPDR
jgi:hypothetical protein